MGGIKKLLIDINQFGSSSSAAKIREAGFCPTAAGVMCIFSSDFIPR
jgi:hypothetical protein